MLVSNPCMLLVVRELGLALTYLVTYCTTNFYVSKISTVATNVAAKTEVVAV